MSAVPRPDSREPRWSSANGSDDQSWPSTETTSMCADRTRPGTPAGPTVAHRLVRSPPGTLATSAPADAQPPGQHRGELGVGTAGDAGVGDELLEQRAASQNQPCSQCARSGGGTSSAGLRSKKPTGRSWNPQYATGITGQSSSRGT